MSSSQLPLCVRSAALNIDEHWKAAKRAETGPIDVVDFFAGCGGMSAGFLSVNGLRPTYRLALAADIDADANASYAANLGLTPKSVDISSLAKDLGHAREFILGARQSPNTPLVMIGCSPCQGFSSHRNAAGKGDLRNSLFVSFARIAASVRPDVVVMENVPELLTDHYWPLVEEARRVLAEAGYTLRLAIHDLAGFGVPQHRFRALLVAMRKPFELPTGFLARGELRTVRNAIAHLSVVQPGQPDPLDAMHVSAGHKKSTIETIEKVPVDGGSRPPEVGPECLRRAAAKQGRAAYEDVYGRLWWDRPAITITAYSRNPASGRYVHPEQHRGLTVREAALLQGFPSDYRFEGSFDSRFRQIGNAVPPAFAASLAAHIANVLNAGAASGSDSRAHDIRRPVGPSFSRLIPAIKAGHRTIESALSEQADAA
jgi:DNA (cytosine-5)-methyltransferase 1